MAPLKQKGDLAELMVAADLRRRGYRIAIPFGEDSDYDLVLDRGGPLEKVQVKHTCSDGRVVVVRCRSFSLTNGRVRETKKHTAAMLDWIAAWDALSGITYYIPGAMLGEGRSLLHLRLDAPRSGRRLGIHWARDYLDC